MAVLHGQVEVSTLSPLGPVNYALVYLSVVVEQLEKSRVASSSAVFIRLTRVEAIIREIKGSQKAERSCKSI